MTAGWGALDMASSVAMLSVAPFGDVSVAESR